MLSNFKRHYVHPEGLDGGRKGRGLRGASTALCACWRGCMLLSLASRIHSAGPSPGQIARNKHLSSSEADRLVPHQCAHFSRTTCTTEPAVNAHRIHAVLMSEIRRPRRRRPIAALLFVVVGVALLVVSWQSLLRLARDGLAVSGCICLLCASAASALERPCRHTAAGKAIPSFLYAGPGVCNAHKGS